MQYYCFCLVPQRLLQVTEGTYPWMGIWKCLPKMWLPLSNCSIINTVAFTNIIAFTFSEFSIIYKLLFSLTFLRQSVTTRCLESSYKTTDSSTDTMHLSRADWVWERNRHKRDTMQAKTSLLNPHIKRGENPGLPRCSSILLLFWCVFVVGFVPVTPSRAYIHLTHCNMWIESSVICDLPSYKVPAIKEIKTRGSSC